MSTLYSRPHTPPSPPPVSQKLSSSRRSRHDSDKVYSDSSKSYIKRDYSSKRSSVDKYDRSKFDKSDKYDRYDKLAKSDYKLPTYVSNKDYRRSYSPNDLKRARSHSREKYVGKTSTYQNDSYRSKGNTYSDQSYLERDNYLSKYPSKSGDKYSKYSPNNKGVSNSKYSGEPLSLNLSNSTGSKKYNSYNSSSKSLSYSKYASDSNSYFLKNDTHFDSYDSFDRGNRQEFSGRGRDDNSRIYSDTSLLGDRKRYSSIEPLDSYAGGYQRYVIGDSVVYGSPGHYPKEVYPPSPKAKRGRSPRSPSPLLSSSKAARSSKSYSRYSISPKRYNSNNKGNSARGTDYSTSLKSSRNSSYRKPPSPLRPLSYDGGLSSQSYSRDRGSRNYTPPPDRGKGYDLDKGGRYYDQRNSLHSPLLKSHFNDTRGFGDSYRRKNDPYPKPYSYQNSNDFHSRDKFSLLDRPRPMLSPKPLLSIPLSVNSIPKESRATVRETLGLPRIRPLNGLDKGSRMRRLDGRVGSRKRNQGSPKDRKKRRPDDLRLWIESRKEGGKPSVSNSGAKGGRGNVKRPQRVGDSGKRSRLLESRRRLLNKKRRGAPQRPGIGMDKARRPLPSKTKSRDEERKPKDGHKKDNPNSANDNSRSKDDISKRRREKKDGDSDRQRGSGSGRASNYTSNARRQIRRPKNISEVNRLPLKPRPFKRSPRRSSQDKDKNSTNNAKNEKNHRNSKSKGKDRSRSPSRSRYRSRSPKRSDKTENRDNRPSSRH